MPRIFRAFFNHALLQTGKGTMRTLTSCSIKWTICVLGLFIIGCGSGDDGTTQNEPATDSPAAVSDPATMTDTELTETTDPALALDVTTATVITDDPTLTVDDPSLTTPDASIPQGLSPEEEATQVEILALVKQLIAKTRPQPANVPPSLALINIGGPGKVIADGVEAVDGRIVKIDLKFTPTSDADLETLAKLTSLEVLGLWGTDVTDAGLKHLTSLPNLNGVLVGYSGVTEAGVAALKKERPDCKVHY